MVYVGIDNGNEGAIVALDAGRVAVLAELTPLIDVGNTKGGKKATKLILDETRAWDILSSLAQAHGPELFVVLEKAQSMPDQGIASAFQYGTGYGCWRMALTALARTHGIGWELAHPATWQKSMLRDIEGGDTKARAILKCQRSIPSLELIPGRRKKPHEGLADAGCMALYGMHLRPPPAVVARATPVPPPPLPR